MASSKHRAPRRSRPISLLLTASAVAAAIAGSVALSGGTYALWNQNSTVPTMTVTSGTLAISASSSFSASAWGKLLPGEKVRQPFSVTNTGNVPVLLSATATTGSTAFEVRVAPGTCPTTALSGASATASTAALGTLAAGATVTECLEVALTASATAGQSVSFSVALAGGQS